MEEFCKYVFNNQDGLLDPEQRDVPPRFILAR